MLGRLKRCSQLSSAREKGYIVYGGESLGDCLMRPAIVEASKQCELVRTETFAPILYVLKYSKLEEAIQLHNGVPLGPELLHLHRKPAGS